MRKRSKGNGVAMMVCLLFVALCVPQWASASSSSALYKFCNHEANSKEMARKVAKITAGIGGIKVTLSLIWAFDQMRNTNAYIAGQVGNLKRFQTPMEILVPASRVAFKAILPTSQMLEKLLKGPEGSFKSGLAKVFKGSLSAAASDTRYETTYARFYYYAIKGFKVWDYGAPLVLAYLGAAQAVCLAARRINPHCKTNAKDKSKCMLPRSYADVPGLYDGSARQSSESGACADTAKQQHIERYFALVKQLAPLFSSITSTNNKLKSIIDPLEAAVSKARQVLSSFNGPAGAAKSAMSALKTTLLPFKLLTNEIEKAMQKQICVKIKIAGKQTKKCMKVERLPKKINGLLKPIKVAMKKAVDTLFKPIINKMLKKIPIPGLSKIAAIANKLGNSFDFYGKMEAAAKAFKSLPLVSNTTQLKSALTSLQSIENGVK